MTGIEKMRKRRKMTIHELAKLSDVSSMTIYRYEHSKRVPNLAIAIRIAKVLGCKVDDLIAGG